MTTSDDYDNILDVTAIVASTSGNVIGQNGTIPWRYPEDMKRFKEVTKDGALIMGRKTFESIPEPKKGGVQLPGRLVIVVTRDPKNVTSTRPDRVVTSVEAALDSVRGHYKPWIIGGGEIYEYAAKHDLIDVWDSTLVPNRPDTWTAYDPGAFTYLGVMARNAMASGLVVKAETLPAQRSGAAVYNPDVPLRVTTIWSKKKVVREWVRVLLSNRGGEEAFRTWYKTSRLTALDPDEDLRGWDKILDTVELALKEERAMLAMPPGYVKYPFPFEIRLERHNGMGTLVSVETETLRQVLRLLPGQTQTIQIDLKPRERLPKDPVKLRVYKGPGVVEVDLDILTIVEDPVDVAPTETATPRRFLLEVQRALV